VSERYVVTSISGYPITPDMHSLDTRNVKWGIEWYVLDTAQCYEIIAVFKSAKKRPGGETAQAFADELNAEEREWELAG
jgi:hypothetical protein